MIFLSLPYMYHNLSFNNYLKDKILIYRMNQKDSIFTFPFEIEMCYGSFPFSNWNGDLNNNYNNGFIALHNEIVSTFATTLTPLCCDCSNINLVEDDLYDVHQNVILQAGENAGNYIELSDLGLLDYLQEHYQNYEYILSKNADLINPLTIDIINVFIEQDIFYLINLPNQLKDQPDELKKITNKNKIMITISNKCPLNCASYNDCILQEQYNQINYSGYTKYNCDYINSYNYMTEILSEVTYYHNLGFSHFKIDSPPYSKLRNFQLYIIENLIKPEHKLRVINDLIDIGAI